MGQIPSGVGNSLLNLHFCVQGKRFERVDLVLVAFEPAANDFLVFLACKGCGVVDRLLGMGRGSSRSES